MWQRRAFDDLSTMKLFEIYKLRDEVFTVEQQRIHNDIDDNDLKTIHVYDELDGQIAAYSRVYLKKPGLVTFGRVVTAPSFRGRGLGNELLHQIMGTIRDYFPGNKIEIDAQVQVEGYYQKFGFHSEGEPYIHASTPHIKMIHAAL